MELVKSKSLGIVFLLVLTLFLFSQNTTAQGASNEITGAVLGRMDFTSVGAENSYSISTNKDIYIQGEQIRINLNVGDVAVTQKYPEFELRLTKNEEQRTYMGEMSFPISFSLDDAGIYSLSLVEQSTGKVLSTKTVTIAQAAIIDNEQINTGMEENITRIVTEIINSMSESGTENDLSMEANCRNAKLNISNKTVNVGHEIFITIEGYNYRGLDDGFELKIIKGESTYRFLGYEEKSRFTPQEEGEYRIIISCNSENVFEDAFFAEREIPIVLELREKQIKIRNAKGQTRNVLMKYYSSGDEKKGFMNSLIGETEVIDSVAEIDLSLEEGLGGSKLMFRNFSSANIGSLEVKVEPLKEENYKVNGRVPIASYAMDLSGINFTNGTFSAIARGNELWKCRDWNYESQQCLGVWEKLFDIVPGREYSFEVTALDPGYAETGVATINTRKSYYLPGEEVEIISVVLDTQGYLVSNASVEITIESPEGDLQVLSTEMEHVVEGQKGIYSTIYSNTGSEGVYTISVYAKGEDAEFNMTSLFEVAHDYDFEIIRNTPAVVDPFRDVLYSSIIIEPRVVVESYNFTEILPLELEVISAPGAIITMDESANRTYLKWSNLAGANTLEYTAQPPLKTPNLLRLGKAYVEYYFEGVLKIFGEIREWVLAIDPEVPTDDGLLVYGDQTVDDVLRYRNWTSDVLRAEQTGPSTGTDVIVWIKLRCQKDLPQCLVGVTNWDGRLFFASFSTDTWQWSINQTLCTDTYNELWSWDLECEGNSNRCIIAYENRSGTNAIDNNANFMYRIWNGTSISNENIATVAGGENRRFNWIKLYPKKNSNVMGIVLQNDFGGTGGTPAIYGGVWNGTGFGTWSTFTTNGPSTGNGRTLYRHFDCGWEGGFGRLLCIYGEDGVNGINAHRYNGSGWVDLQRIYNGTAEVLQVAVCGQEPESNFNHNYVGIMDCDTLADLDGGYWNGSKFSKNVASDAPAKNTNSECGNRQAQNQYGQNFQCVWENGGNQSVFVWVRNSADSFLTSGTFTSSTREFSMDSWASGVKITATGTAELRTSTLVSNPYNDKVFLVYTDAQRRGGCSLWRGSTWDGSGCNNATYFEGDGGSAARHWLGFDWFRLRLEPYITIIRPAIIKSDYTYWGVAPLGTQMGAFNGNFSALPPPSANAPITGFEFTAGNYFDVSLMDDSYTSSVFSGALTGQRAYQSFRFYVSDPSISMSSIKFMYEGYATRTTSLTPDDYDIYFYNWATDSYVLVRRVYGGTGGEIYTETLLTGSFTDYVRNNYFYVLVEAYTPSGATVATRRSEITTDYAALEVQSTPVLSGMQRYNVSATDEDGVSGCRWAYYNMSHSNVSGRTEMSLAGAYYYNITNTALMPDGNYYIYAFCNDTLGNSRNNSVQVRLDNTLPQIFLVIPPNASNFTVNYVYFEWNTTDIPYENMACNLTIDGVVKDSNRISPHDTIVGKNVTAIADGTHMWYVRCVDDAGNMNVSENRTFDTDTTPPAVALNYPPSQSSINYIPFDMNFTVTDSHPISNCSVYVDGTINATLYSVNRSVQTNYTVDSMPEGLHRWNVSCYDSFGFRGNSALRNFTLDFGKPWITLGTADNAVFNGTPAQFNFTAYDTLDPVMVCNITANEEVVAANIAAPNGSLRVINVSLVDGYKVWYVTCWDDAGNINMSEQRTIRMIGGPLVVLQVPKNGTIGNGTDINFTYYVQDGDGLSNCSLYIDGIINQTEFVNISNFANNTFLVADLPEAVHNWSVGCYDLSLMDGSSAVWRITSDRSPPEITLYGPAPGQMVFSIPARFNMSMTDAYSPNSTCNLTVDGTVSTVHRNFILQNNTFVSKSETYSNGLHYWNVTCRDMGGNINTSETRNFTVNVTMPITVSVIADKPVYQIPEYARINVTTKNDTNHYIASNITMDYIYTNTTYTDVPWWNVSYPQRKPIFINETQGLARTQKPVPVNVTLPYGTISSCAEHLRIVEDDTLQEVAYNVVSGDDVSYCYIVFNATVSAGANNEQDYHVYYGNLSVPAPAYQNLLGAIPILYDNFGDGTLGTDWTYDAGWDVTANSPLAGSHAHVDGVVTLASIRMTNYANLQYYDWVNLSFNWGIDADWDAGEFFQYQFTNDSGFTWNIIEQFNGGAGAMSSAESIIINSTYKTGAFNVRFRATTNNANEEGGFDNFNLTGYNSIQVNTSAGLGREQIFLERLANATNQTGMIMYYYSTSGKILGNYSAVVLATSTNPKLRAGSGYDYFTIIEDNFGPNITLITPGNGITNRTGVYNLTFNATDIANGIRNCSLIVNGAFNQSNSSAISNGGISYFTLAASVEGRYNWSVICYDELNNSGTSTTFTFYLDDTPPVIIPFEPNMTTLPSGTITFRFNATDNIDSLLYCNITVDGIYSRTLNANNGSITTTTVNSIPDGEHIWNVTCEDNINNSATSETLNFSTATIPIVRLHSPRDGYGVNSTDIVLYYNLSSSNVVNCSLLINGTINQTFNSSEIQYKANEAQNNFTLTGINYGIYTWNVICYDTNMFNGTDITRTFHLDDSVPILVPYYPGNGEQVFTRNVNFYFNVSDTVDNSLTCNLTLDGVVNRTNISAISGANTSVLVSGLSMGAHGWSVRCVDNAGFVASSAVWSFTVESRVGVFLVSPPNNTYDADGTLSLGYLPQSTSGFNLGFCDLYIDNAYSQKKAAPTVDVTNYFNVSGLSQGLHTWHVNCTDNTGVVNYSSKWNIIIDGSPPAVTTHYPDGHSFTSSTVFFNWTATDNTDPNMSCSVYINGTLKVPGNIVSPNGSVANATYSGIPEGTFDWYVICLDDAGNSVQSTNKTFSVSENPVVNLGNPANGTRTRVQNQSLYFTATDNSGTISNCTLIFDDVINQTRTGVVSGVQNHFNVTNIANGVHNWTVSCRDPAGNTGVNNTPRTLIIDLDAPNITQYLPPDGSYLGGNNVLFNWTAVDYPASSIVCQLYIDGSLNRTITQLSGSYYTPTINNMTDGSHIWNVTCNDSLGNFVSSPTWTFTINQPDLYIDDTRIFFNNTNPNENQTINITANISNIGGVPLTNVLVEFWDGNPAAGGIFIANSTGTINYNSSRIFSALWNITPGFHTIYVVGDPYNTTGELNDSNNIGMKNISLLKSIIMSPPNASSFARSDINITFNISDFTGGVLNYTIYDGNTINATGQANDGTETIVTLNLSQGTHTIRVQAQDALGRRKNSTAITITIDYTPPSATINTANGTWYNYSTPNISITAADNTDSMINYTIYANGIANTAGNISSGATVSLNLTSLSDGRYDLVMEVFDDLGNILNSTIKTIFVDTSAPSILMYAPDNGANFLNRTVTFNYTPQDNLAFIGYCNLTLDGVIVNSQSGTVGEQRVYTASGLAEGTHYWNVTCRDQAYNFNVSETRSFNVFIEPAIALISPANNAWVKTSENTFYFNVSDETGIQNCSILLNGSVASTINAANINVNSTSSITVSGMEGTYTWAIACYDSTAMNRYNVSSNRTINVDIRNPSSQIYTQNDTWFNVNPTLHFNLSDNMDGVLNYTIYVNGTANLTGSANNGQNASATLTTLSNGSYEIVIEARDEAMNYFNSTPIIIGFDTIRPAITLLYPANNTSMMETTTDLNFTAIDNSGRLMMCNLTLDGVIRMQNMSVYSGQIVNYTASSLGGGYHYWNVTCVDLAGNRNTSETWNFYVLRSDIYVNSSNIVFNNSAPKENETISITALIENIGTTAAANFTVEFWNGIPGQGGRQINGNTSINLSAGESKNVTVNYVASLGTQTIWVFADRTNIIAEENDSNNNGSATIAVGLWHFAMGDTQDKLVTMDANFGLLYDWEIDNSTDSNIFVVDSDSDLNWLQLQALGRDTTEGARFEDFAELDAALNATAFADSVNATYTSGGAVLETDSYTIYGRLINNVPIHDSTDSANFKTGILWDYGDGGVQYNGTQDVAFVTRMRNQLSGHDLQIHDYEIRIPATLRSYKGPSFNSVDFYMEIK